MGDNKNSRQGRAQQLVFNICIIASLTSFVKFCICLNASLVILANLVQV
jgi:hypothetical protein